MLCGEKPTKSLLNRIYSNLPTQINAVAAEVKYETKMVFEEAAIIISSPDKEKKYVQSEVFIIFRSLTLFWILKYHVIVIELI